MQCSAMFGSESESAGSHGNGVFNEYQQTQYDRIREIREEIKTRSNRFGEFGMNARRRADQEEFNSFMSDGPYSKSTGSTSV